MKINRGLQILTLALACAVGTSGCTTKQVLATVGIGAAAGAGYAAYAYSKGDLEAKLDHKLDKVYDATLKVIEKRDYDLKDKDKDDDKARIEAEIPNKDDKALKINLEEDGKETKISIRVGVFGDEDLSKSILRDIEDRLK
jgi:hypothetical protein